MHVRFRSHTPSTLRVADDFVCQFYRFAAIERDGTTNLNAAGAACADQRGEILHYRISERVSDGGAIALDLDREVWRAMSQAKAVKRPVADRLAAG